MPRPSRADDAKRVSASNRRVLLIMPSRRTGAS
nr:MAG TPA_asm: hypothetical protein [Caudoviricetes sp.]